MPENENVAMKAKDYDLALLMKTDQGDLQVAAARAYGEKKWLSSIALFLNTHGIPDTAKLQEEGIQDLQKDDRIFTQFLQKENASNEARSIVLQWKNMVALLIEVASELAKVTAEIELDKNGNPLKRQPDLDDGAEPGGDPNIKLSSAVRGPLVLIPPFNRCHENNFPLAVECGGCAVVVKEFRGLQLRLVLRRITKVLEPWTSRARIIYRWVWVLEWVPVEVIKTISVRCCCDDKRAHITKQVVLDRELSSFWRCL